MGTSSDDWIHDAVIEIEETRQTNPAGAQRKLNAAVQRVDREVAQGKNRAERERR